LFVTARPFIPSTTVLPAPAAATLALTITAPSRAEEEHLMQLAGHLKGRALQEWNLLRPEERSTFSIAIKSLRARVDSSNKTLAAQDFRHTMQKDGEPAADLIRRLKRTFRVAYSRDIMSAEMRDALMYGQFQEGLRYEIVRAPACLEQPATVASCLDARNEEKLLRNGSSIPNLHNSSAPSSLHRKPQRDCQAKEVTTTREVVPKGGHSHKGGSPSGKKCYRCKKPGHLMSDCRSKKAENKAGGAPTTKQITSSGAPAEH